MSKNRCMECNKELLEENQNFCSNCGMALNTDACEYKEAQDNKIKIIQLVQLGKEIKDPDSLQVIIKWLEKLKN